MGNALIKQRSEAKQHFEFVNSTEPRRPQGSEVRKLIRRHVRNDFVRLHGGAKGGQKNDDIPVSISAKPQATLPYDYPLDEENSLGPMESSNIPRPFGFPTETSAYPIEMTEKTHALFSHYLTCVSSRMFPIEYCLKSNPLKSPDWIRFAVTDSAMFHAVLYAAAVCLALVQGRRESKDIVHHQSRTIPIIQQRLHDSTSFMDDSTLGAISCLALGEVGQILLSD